jgi:hypothetical protein
MVDLLDQHLDLALAAETGAVRYRTGAYTFWRAHLRVLLRDAGVPDPGDVLADVLLAPLAGELYQHLRDRGESKRQLSAALADLAHRTLGGPAPRSGNDPVSPAAAARPDPG